MGLWACDSNHGNRGAVEQLPIHTTVKEPHLECSGRIYRQPVHVPIALLSTLRQKGKRGPYLPEQEV